MGYKDSSIAAQSGGKQYNRRFSNFLNTGVSPLTQDSHASGSYANYLLRLFLVDLTDRIKLERKHKRSDATQVIFEFLDQFSESDEPVRFLEKLDFSIFSDFQTFLSSSLSNIDREFQDGSGTNTYQVLTENIETTAEYVNSLLSELIQYPELIEKLARFLKGDYLVDFSSDTLSPSSTEEDESEKDNEASLFPPPTQSRDSVEKISEFPAESLDYGFKFNELFAEPAEETNSQIDEEVETEAIDDAESSEFFKRLLSALHDIISSNKKPEIIYQVFQKISQSKNKLSEIEKLKSIPDFESFINFYLSFKETGFDQVTSEMLSLNAAHLVKVIETALHNSQHSLFLHDYVAEFNIPQEPAEDFSSFEAESELLFSSLTSSDESEEPEPVPSLSEAAMKAFTSEIETELNQEETGTKPEAKKETSGLKSIKIQDASYIFFIKAILEKVQHQLPNTEAGIEAENALSKIFLHPDTCSVLALSNIPCLIDFVEFISNLESRQVDMSTLSSHSIEIISELSTQLIKYFEEGGSFELNLEDISDGSSEAEDDNELVHKEKLLDEKYLNFTHTVLDQVKINLQNTPSIVAYINTLSENTHVTEALCNSDIDCLKNFGGFLATSRQKAIDPEVFSDNASEIISTITNDILELKKRNQAPEPEDIEDAVSALDIKTDFPLDTEIPTLSDFDLGDITEDLVSLPSLDEEENILPEDELEKDEAPAAPTLQGYSEFVAAILHQVKSELHNSPDALALINTLLKSDALTEALSKTGITCLTGFAGFVQSAERNQLEIENLLEHREGIVTALVNELKTYKAPPPTELTESNEEKSQTPEAPEAIEVPEPPEVVDTESKKSRTKFPIAEVDEELSLSDLFATEQSSEEIAELDRPEHQEESPTTLASEPTIEEESHVTLDRSNEDAELLSPFEQSALETTDSVEDDTQTNADLFSDEPLPELSSLIDEDSPLDSGIILVDHPKSDADDSALETADSVEDDTQTNADLFSDELLPELTALTDEDISLDSGIILVDHPKSDADDSALETTDSVDDDTQTNADLFSDEPLPELSSLIDEDSPLDSGIILVDHPKSDADDSVLETTDSVDDDTQTNADLFSDELLPELTDLTDEDISLDSGIILVDHPKSDADDSALETTDSVEDNTQTNTDIFSDEPLPELSSLIDEDSPLDSGIILVDHPKSDADDSALETADSVEDDTQTNADLFSDEPLPELSSLIDEDSPLDSGIILVDYPKSDADDSALETTDSVDDDTQTNADLFSDEPLPELTDLTDDGELDILAESDLAQAEPPTEPDNPSTQDEELDGFDELILPENFEEEPLEDTTSKTNETLDNFLTVDKDELEFDTLDTIIDEDSFEEEITDAFVEEISDAASEETLDDDLSGDFFNEDLALLSKNEDFNTLEKKEAQPEAILPEAHLEESAETTPPDQELPSEDENELEDIFNSDLLLDESLVDESELSSENDDISSTIHSLNGPSHEEPDDLEFLGDTLLDDSIESLEALDETVLPDADTHQDTNKGSDSSSLGIDKETDAEVEQLFDFDSESNVLEASETTTNIETDATPVETNTLNVSDQATKDTSDSLEFSEDDILLEDFPSSTEEQLSATDTSHAEPEETSPSDSSTEETPLSEEPTGALELPSDKQNKNTDIFISDNLTLKDEAESALESDAFDDIEAFRKKMDLLTDSDQHLVETQNIPEATDENNNFEEASLIDENEPLEQHLTDDSQFLTQDTSLTDETSELLTDAGLDTDNISMTDTLESLSENAPEEKADENFILDDSFLNDDSLVLDDSSHAETESSDTAPQLEDKPTTYFQPDEIQLLFLEEAYEYLTKLNEDLLELDKTIGTVQTERVNCVLRSSHTLKGSAAMVQLNHISELGHKMEDALQVIRDNNLKTPAPLVDLLFQAVDSITNMINHFKATGKDDNEDSHEIIEKLVDYTNQLASTGEITSTELSGFQPDEIQQAFLEEATEYLEKLHADLLELDKLCGTEQPEIVHRALRSAHTMKGSAAMVQLQNIRALSHKMEDVLQIIHDGNLKVPRLLVDRLSQSVDAITTMLSTFKKTGEDTYENLEALTDSLTEYETQLHETGELTETEGKAPFKPNEIQQIFLEEASEFIDKLNADLLALDKAIDTVQPDLVNRVMREAHTLKGSAAMVQLGHISELAHKMEDSLQFVRDNNVKIPRPLVDVLFQSVDVINEMINHFKKTGTDDSSHQPELVSILQSYFQQLEEKGTILEIGRPQQLVRTPETEEKIAKPSGPKQATPASVAEQTVRIDIGALNHLVNLSAELVIARNRLNNELSSIYSIINKFLRERNSLGQVSKKIMTSIQKGNQGKQENDENDNESAEGLTEAVPVASASNTFSDVLKEFSESEFDRFSDLDIISRDVKTSMLNFDDSIKELRDLTTYINQNITKVSNIANDLNRVIVGMRMVPVKQMFIRFSRSVRDIAKNEEKKINLLTEGEDTKLDKMVMEDVIEPMMHIVRNSIGHGIEKPEDRRRTGKNEVGQLVLRAYQKGNRVILEVEDDGKGISVDKVKQKALEKGLITDAEAQKITPEATTELIFRPGFSTAEKVTELHGRGVGLDVVYTTIRNLKGFVNIETKEGQGTKFIISLPLTLAISDALLIEAAGNLYAIPLDTVSETINIPDETIEHEEDKKFITIRGERLELVYLNDLLEYDSDVLKFKATLPVVVIELEDRKVAVGIEKVINKEEIVVKTLGSHLRNVRGVIGATIMGDGQVVIILDMNYLLRSPEAKGRDVYITFEAQPMLQETAEEAEETKRQKRQRKGEKITVLAADDSPSVRKYIQSVLHQAGIDVISVDDGLNALNKLPTANCDIIVTDLEMPRMNGFELVSEVRKLSQYKELPIIVVTARAGDKHRRKGLELGANAFLNKPFDPVQLVETIESFIS